MPKTTSSKSEKSVIAALLKTTVKVLTAQIAVANRLGLTVKVYNVDLYRKPVISVTLDIKETIEY